MVIEQKPLPLLEGLSFSAQLKEMRYSTNTQGEYDHFQVTEEQPLLEFLLANVKQSKNKIKLTLQGQGVKVNGKR